MFPLGQTRYITLRLYTSSGIPVTGVKLNQIPYAFFRNNAPCTDVLSLVELGSGYYNVVYTPSAIGSDYFAVLYAPTNYLLETRETIVDLANVFSTGNAVSVTQNYGGISALRPVGISNTSSYTLYVYNSSDWNSGNTDTSQAMNSTALDSLGNWISSTMELLHGTYHFVLRNTVGTVIVFKANVVI